MPPWAVRGWRLHLACAHIRVCLVLAAGSMDFGTEAADRPAGIALLPLPTTSPLSENERLRVHSGPSHWTAELSGELGRFGHALLATDWNADGFTDLLVGAPRFSRGVPRTGAHGAIIVFPGSRAGLGTNPAAVVLGDRVRGHLGRALGIAPDGLRKSAVWVGAPLTRLAFPEEGTVTCLEPTSPQHEARCVDLGLCGKSPGGRFGSALAGIGDVNGDGYPDLAVAASRATYRNRHEGGVFVYPGSAQGLLTRDPRWLWPGGQAGAECGWSIAPLGDVNSDGCADFLVGSPGFDGTAPDMGRVSLVLGSASGPRTEPGWTAVGLRPNECFGCSLAVLDLNRDGRPDVAVGAPGISGSSAQSGRVYLFLGSSGGFADTPALTLDGGQSGEQFGTSVAVLPPQGSDGFPLLAVGAPGFDGDHPNCGRVCVFTGRPGGLTLSPDRIFVGCAAGQEFGHTVAAGGDMDGDGATELLVGSPMFGRDRRGDGRVDVLWGRNLGNALDHLFPVDGTHSALVELRIRKDDAAEEPGRPMGVGPGSTVGAAQAGTWAAGTGIVLGLTAVWYRQRRRLDAERRRLARDLHDQMGPHLVRLAKIADERSANEGPKAPVADLRAAARAISQAVDEAVWEVHPERNTLEDLVGQLGLEAERLFAGTTTRCWFDLAEEVPDRRVPRSWRKGVLFTVREALTNTLKHARATEVWLRLRVEPGGLTVVVEDNGIGGVKPDSGTFRHGLRNMRARIESIRGRCKVSLRVGGGTTVEIWVPW